MRNHDFFGTNESFFGERRRSRKSKIEKQPQLNESELREWIDDMVATIDESQSTAKARHQAKNDLVRTFTVIANELQTLKSERDAARSDAMRFAQQFNSLADSILINPQPARKQRIGPLGKHLDPKDRKLLKAMGISLRRKSK